MIDFILKSSVCLVVFLGFYHLFLEKEKIHFFNRFYLLISIIISLLIPFLNFEIIKEIPVQQKMETIRLDHSHSVSAVDMNSTTATVLPLEKTLEETVDYLPFLLWTLYIIVASLLLIRFAKNISQLISKTKSNPTVKHKNAHLILLNEKVLPHTFLNSIFINFDDYNHRNIEDELYTHELVHVTQKHTIDILFIEALKSIFWFNPLFYFYKKAIQLNHEFLADEGVVKQCNDVPFYQTLLLQKNSINHVFLTSNLNYSITKKRLIMMTKNTTKTLALLKKAAILPILIGIIYFFCIEIVAQEKTSNPIEGKTVKTLSEEDKIRDHYYSNVRVILNDLRTNTSIDKMYEELSLEEKRLYIRWVPDVLISKEIPESLFQKMKTNNMAVWIDGKVKSKEDIQKYKRTDFSYYSYSFVHKNARTKRFPQEYQYTLYTKKYFDQNLKNSHLHFSNDTLRMTISNKNDKFNKVSEILNNKKTKADTIVWFSKDKKEYNLHINKNKKTIVIDAGHGGIDWGATQDDLKEKILISEITNKIKEMHSDADVSIHFTRTKDEFISLKDRVDFIENLKPDLVISLHMNSNKNEATSGFEIFISDKSNLIDKTTILADKLSSKLSETQLTNRGLKTAPFMILKNVNYPAMIVELGFITNENDRKFVSSEKGQTEIAKTILEFIYGIK